MRVAAGFFMDQIAGHTTNYLNLRSVVHLAPWLDADWHEIHYKRPAGAIERLRARLLPFVPTYATGILRGTYEMRRAIRARRYDVLFTNASVGVFFSRAFRSTPTMLDFDSTPLQIDRMGTYGGPVDAPAVAQLKWRLFRDKLRSATLLQAWSSWAKRSVVEEYGIAAEKVIVNPPGVNLRYWRPAPRPRSDSEGPLRVLFVGGDFRRKGGPALLDWHRTMDPARVELHLVTREPVHAHPGVFVYHDMQPNTERLLELYWRSDLFVLPSLGECFGIASVEAMAVGLPVIATDVGGTADIVEDGRSGFIVPRGDQARLCRAIETILARDELRRAMGERGRALAAERFDLERNARRTFDHLRQIARPTAVAAAGPARSGV